MTSADLRARVYVITGASRQEGIGTAVARRLAAAGADLVLHSWTSYDAAQHDGRPGGRAILLTSGQHLGGMPGELPYVISKGAVQQMTATLAAELAPRGIIVNCVNPGPTDTGWAGSEEERIVLERMPQGRWGQPDDAARLITWLLSGDGVWVTGQTIDAEGGIPPLTSALQVRVPEHGRACGRFDGLRPRSRSARYVCLDVRMECASNAHDMAVTSCEDSP